MRFADSDDQVALRASLRDFVAKYAPVAATRATMACESGHDADLWRRLSVELGLQGLMVPERFDGSGAGAVEMSIVMEELGRTLASPALLPTVLTSALLTMSDDEAACADYLPELTTGTAIGTTPTVWLRPNHVLPTATSAGGWTLDGEMHLVLNAHIADVIVVCAAVGDGIGLFVVRATATGLTKTLRTGLDPTRRIGDLTFLGTPAHRIACSDPGLLIERVLKLRALLVSAEAVGGAEACLRSASEHVRNRTAFGRTLGSFQAVKHRCADMYLGVEAARCATMYSAWTYDDDERDRNTNADAAQHFSSRTYMENASGNIQLHGAVGFTWEHDAHLFLKRAQSNQSLFSSYLESR